MSRIKILINFIDGWIHSTLWAIIESSYFTGARQRFFRPIFRYY